MTDFISFSMPYALIWAGVLLAFLGFFRSVFEKVKPDFILNQKKVQDEWLSRSPFTAILLPVMALTIFIFNAFAWMVHGLISIVTFIAFILKALWWVVLWIWNEVLHPVVFFIFKLLWHYIIIWSWRFFNISFTRITEAFSKDTFKNGFISTFVFSFIFFSFIYLRGLIEQNWILSIMFVALLFGGLYLSGYTLFDDKIREFKDYYAGMMISRLGIMVLIVISCISTILILSFFNDTAILLPVLGISFPVSQILIMILVVFVIASLVSISILPAYMVSTNGSFEMKDFLINTLKRLPRLLGVGPFVVFAGIVASIGTIILGGFLWWSTNSIKTFFCEKSLDNIQIELAEEHDNYYKYYHNVDQVEQSEQYPEKKIKRIAKLESRIYSLELAKKCWDKILFNLSDGIRDVDAEKDVLPGLQNNFHKTDSLLREEIAEQKKLLNELSAQLSNLPGDSTLLEDVERQSAKLRSLEFELKQQKVQFLFDTKLAEARVNSTNATNVMWIIGTFFALFGFALLAAIILTPYWILRTKVYFDLYDYYHEGKSYFEEQVAYYNHKNNNQPLLGWFVFIGLAALFFVLNIILRS
ncbi:MAG: hypothetical protein ACLFVR_12605 [Thiohalospira sp.]